jgi:Domain of Unknown Function (DUF1080)
MRSLTGCLLWLAVTTTASAADTPNGLSAKQIEEGWILLFDGETTFGWKADGDVAAKDGALALGGDKTARASLTSEFGNCELALDYTGDGHLVLDGGAVGCNHALVSPGDWHSLLLDIAFSPAAKGASIGFEPGGKARATYNTQHLFMGFAVEAGKQLSLRNVRLRPDGLQAVLNGKDLSGWKEVKTSRTKSEFSVTPNGELHIKNGPGDIQTEDQWADFVLQLDVFSNGPHLNSGVFFRCLPGQFWQGYEAQIRNQWQGDDRNKPIDYGTGGIYNRQPARKVVSSDHEWFTMTIAASGKHLAIWVNGYQTADFTDNRPPAKSARNGSKVDKGPISLQGHDKTTDLSFRKIRIAELPRTN